ncbi:helix-turn-helix domain-containing protein [Burkholderia gladioli]|uniref:helix-turn-helix domain-containing protein n=1 Tax=Burkholderia gladioli TaxID=28095 RepID=UPI003C7E6B25
MQSSRQDMSTEPKSAETNRSGIDAKLIAERVRNLFDSKGIAKRRHAATIGEYLHLSPSQAHRKIKGDSPWTLAQIREIASAFGVAPAELLQEADDEENLNYLGQRCILAIGNDELPCLAQIGAEIVADASPPLFVALWIGDHWRVYRAPHAPAGKKYFVEKIEIDGRQSTPDKPLIAILDDNGDAANELARALQKRNFSAIPFHSSSALLAAMDKTTFGGFVLDWMLETETARNCIEAIRIKRGITAPIVILTAYMGHAEHANSIAEMMTTYKIIGPYEKPARAPVIAAALEPHYQR